MLYIFLLFLTVTTVTLNNIQTSISFYIKIYILSWLPIFPSPFHILPCVRYILNFTWIDSSIDRPSIDIPPPAPNPQLLTPASTGPADSQPSAFSTGQMAPSSLRLVLSHHLSLPLICQLFPGSIPFPVMGSFFLVHLYFHFGWFLGVMEGECVHLVHLHETDVLGLIL